MKRLAALVTTMSLLASAGAHANSTVLAHATSPPSPAASQGQGELRISRPGSQPSARGPVEWFTGSVRVDPMFPPMAPSRVSGGLVTFEPGARSAWHTHPVGQILIVTEGVGWIQREGRPVEEIRPGDVVQIPPGVRHWHGAAATTGMTHISLTEEVDGRNATWMEKVTDDQYRR
jgi:quercetin dioxygenase-like cupin family protein